jgi:ATP-binding cassette, subfamily B, bacterial
VAETDNKGNSSSAWRDRVQALKNVPPVLKIVWDSGPHVVVLGLLLRVVVSVVPVSTSWVTGSIVQTVTTIVDKRQTNLLSHLWWLVVFEFSLAVGGSFFGRVIDYYDSVLADRYTRHVSVQVMD